VDSTTVNITNLINGGLVEITAGNAGGAFSGKGQAGGSVNKLKVSITAGQGSLNLSAGDASGSGATPTDNGIGGGIDATNITLGIALQLDELVIESGNGGEGSAVAGAGGLINKLVIQSSAAIDDLSILAGDGGDSSGATGGIGGAITDSKVTSSGSISGTNLVRSGDGGSSGGTFAGGTGGLVSEFTLVNTGPLTVGDTLTIRTGNGGDAVAAGGIGGLLEKISVSDKAGSGQFVLRAGAGGDGTTGGNAGLVTGISLSGSLSSFVVGADGASGGDGSDGNGGFGGTVEKVTGSAGRLILVGGQGGAANGTLVGRIGGDGGNVTDIDVKVTFFAQQIRSGNGGGTSVDTGGTGGDGGAIEGIQIKGDIGNFYQPFGAAVTQMGGLIVGLAGSGSTANGVTGTINDVQATRIAAMFAGDSSTSGTSLSAANAVSAIAEITADVIGADLNEDSIFDFTDSGGDGFILGTPDMAIDGLVIALTAGYNAASVSVVPLKLILV
jgi:hypothetical protein